jgi:hypothetical protein
MQHPRTVGVLLATATGVALVVLGLAHGQQIHRNGFEGREVAWVRGPADATFREVLHDMTDATAHTGQLSEHLQVVAEQGTFIHYFYATGRAPVGEELGLSVWLKANRPNAQLAARVVLPKERNPNNLDEPLTTLLRGDVYQRTTRWQRLALSRPVKLLQEQQQLMQAQSQRALDFTDAYIDRVVLNVYSGPGQTELWIDDLEIGPVLDTAPFQPTSRPAEKTGRPTRPGQPPAAPPTRTAVVELNQDRLLVNGRRFFLRGIRLTDTPPKVLREAGLNAVWVDPSTPPAVLDEAVNLGFWLVPSLPLPGEETQREGDNGLGQLVSRFMERDSLLFWDLGGGLAQEQAPGVAHTAQLVRSADPQRPLGADVWDGFRPYSRHLDLLGVHRWPLLTALELRDYREWLDQRRRLARPGTFLWTWVQTHLPDWYTTLVYDRPATAAFTEPIGPQPEQIRLLTYVALASGCRGLGFWSDRFLADSHQGRDRLLGLALLNQELKMLEPLLITAEAPTWIPTSAPDVQAAVLRCERGVLVLPMWLDKGAQYVPGQSARASLDVVVPQVPIGTQAWEISPGEVRSLRSERVLGGTKVTVPEFGMTAAILFTSDSVGPNSLIPHLQDQARQMRPVAAQWATTLAEAELEKVSRVYTDLERRGHGTPDGPALMDDARRRLQLTSQYLAAGEARHAYLEAQRVVRPLRILMRACWDDAVKGLDLPVASPYAVSYFTLPRHWQFMDRVKQAAAGTNVLPEGGFETDANGTTEAWTLQEATLDEVELIARRVAEDPKEGKQCLLLEVKAKVPDMHRGGLERTFLAINSPAVRLPPGTLVRISGWVRLPYPTLASPDGALLYDSAGGEPLAIRWTKQTKWKQFTLYRQVPASGMINVTLALTAIGKVYFDDIRIEPLEAGTGRPVAGRDGAPAVPVSRSRP